MRTASEIVQVVLTTFVSGTILMYVTMLVASGFETPIASVYATGILAPLSFPAVCVASIIMVVRRALKVLPLLTSMLIINIATFVLFGLTLGPLENDGAYSELIRLSGAAALAVVPFAVALLARRHFLKNTELSS